jgi:anti-repressor protein
MESTNNNENAMQIFDFKDHKVRTVIKEGEVWFVLKDVCDVLEIGNSRQVASRLDSDEKDDVITNDAIGRQQKTTIINEPGFYSVFVLSRKPEAHEFKRWIYHDVLPSIRKTGSYSTHQMSEEERLQELLNLDGDVVIAYGQKLKQNKLLQAKVEQLECQIEDDKSKVEFANEIAAASGGVSVSSMAKILTSLGYKTGRNRLLKELADNGIVIRDKAIQGYIPSQRHMNQHWFINHLDYVGDQNNRRIYSVISFTGLGVRYCIEHFIKKSLISQNMLGLKYKLRDNNHNYDEPEYVDLYD